MHRANSGGAPTQRGSSVVYRNPDDLERCPSDLVGALLMHRAVAAVRRNGFHWCDSCDAWVSDAAEHKGDR